MLQPEADFNAARVLAHISVRLLANVLRASKAQRLTHC